MTGKNQLYNDLPGEKKIQLDKSGGTSWSGKINKNSNYKSCLTVEELFKSPQGRAAEAEGLETSQDSKPYGGNSVFCVAGSCKILHWSLCNGSIMKKLVSRPASDMPCMYLLQLCNVGRPMMKTERFFTSNVLAIKCK